MFELFASLRSDVNRKAGSLSCFNKTEIFPNANRFAVLECAGEPPNLVRSWRRLLASKVQLEYVQQNLSTHVQRRKLQIVACSTVGNKSLLKLSF